MFGNVTYCLARYTIHSILQYNNYFRCSLFSSHTFRQPHWIPLRFIAVLNDICYITKPNEGQVRSPLPSPHIHNLSFTTLQPHLQQQLIVSGWQCLVLRSVPGPVWSVSCPVVSGWPCAVIVPVVSGRPCPVIVSPCVVCIHYIYSNYQPWTNFLNLNLLWKPSQYNWATFHPQTVPISSTWWGIEGWVCLRRLAPCGSFIHAKPWINKRTLQLTQREISSTIPTAQIV